MRINLYDFCFCSKTCNTPSTPYDTTKAATTKLVATIHLEFDTVETGLIRFPYNVLNDDMFSHDYFHLQCLWYLMILNTITKIWVQDPHNLTPFHQKMA